VLGLILRANGGAGDWTVTARSTTRAKTPVPIRQYGCIKKKG
jgi:hypothetical protein